MWKIRSLVERPLWSIKIKKIFCALCLCSGEVKSPDGPTPNLLDLHPLGYDPQVREGPME